MIKAFVSTNSTCTANCRTVVCFIAGVITYQNNFEAAAREIAERYRDAKILVIFPYGLANGKEGASLIGLLSKQLVQAGYDLAWQQSRRVISTAEMIREQAVGAKQLILIGHSAGGVIAYRTGLYLEQEYEVQGVQVFTVGCPKFYLKDIPFNDRFTYITGQNRDRITQIGAWRKPGSKVYRGRPGRELHMEFNPIHQGWRFHASYFLKSSWTDSNQVLKNNSEALISKIHEIYPDE